MPQHAKPRCAEHHRAALKRIINTLPPSYLLIPSSGELFKGLKEYNRRLRGYALAKDFDIIKYKSGIKALFNYKFKYIFYDNTTQNYRKLKNLIKKNLKK